MRTTPGSSENDEPFCIQEEVYRNAERDGGGGKWDCQGELRRVLLFSSARESRYLTSRGQAMI